MAKSPEAVDGAERSILTQIQSLSSIPFKTIQVLCSSASFGLSKAPIREELRCHQGPAVDRHAHEDRHHAHMKAQPTEPRRQHRGDVEVRQEMNSGAPQEVVGLKGSVALIAALREAIEVPPRAAADGEVGQGHGGHQKT